MTGDDDVIRFRKRADATTASAGFTHTAFAFRRIGKKYGRYLEVGVARLPPCEHCGGHPIGDVKVFLDRLPIGGFSGGLLLKGNGIEPPQLQPEHPDQTEFDEKEILPES